MEAEFIELAEESEAMEVRPTQLGYEFEIRQPYSIPSDGKSVAAEIGRYRLPATYTYRRRRRQGRLVAEATDWANSTCWRARPTSISRTRSWQSILSPEAGDTLRFSMGRDRGIRIERTKESDYSARRAIGSNQTQSMGWKLAVRNTRTEPVTRYCRTR